MPNITGATVLQVRARVQIDDRQSHVPQVYYKSPLQRLFLRFDADRKGVLTASQVHEALCAAGVCVQLEQVRPE